jgi:hypothetical protein
MSIEEAKAVDPCKKYGKGGGLVDGMLVREFPVRRHSIDRAVPQLWKASVTAVGSAP